MSVRLMERVFWAKGLGKTRKLVLLAIADAANDGGFGYLLISTLAKKTDLSERTIQQAIAEMCDASKGEPLLEKRERHNRASIFRIHVEKLEQHERWTSDREMSIEEMWGESPAPQKSSRGESPAPRGESHDKNLSSDSPRTVLEPFNEPNPPLPSVEAPPQEFSLDLVSEDPRSVDIVEYVVSEWKKLKAEFPRVKGIAAINPSRTNAIKGRARELVAASAGQLTAHDVWDQIFRAIRISPFLRGDGEPGKGYSQPFAVDIDYITRPKVFLSTLERYEIDAERFHETHNPDTGRRYGPAEKAMRAVLARLGHGS